jgi:Fur family ferric uptake transcriptional regulator
LPEFIFDTIQNLSRSTFVTLASDQPDVSAALRKAGLQVTAQRLAVYRAVQTSPHAMTDDHCDSVRAEIDVISRQAVYNSLNAMFEHGLKRRIQPAGSAARYEVRVDNHHHLVRRESGSLVDTDCATGEAPCLGADDEHGCLIDEAQVISWGTYRGCRSETKPQRKT